MTGNEEPRTSTVTIESAGTPHEEAATALETNPQPGLEEAPAAVTTLSDWKAIRIVARREITGRLQERTFLISVGITLIGVALVVVIPSLLGMAGHRTFTVGVTGPQAAAMQDVLTRKVATAGTTLHVTPVVDAADGRAEVAAGRLDAFMTGDRIVVQDLLDPQLGTILQEAHADAVVRANLRAATGLDATAVQQVLTAPALRVDSIALPNQDPERTQTRRGIALIGVFVLFTQMSGYGLAVASSIAMEKGTRVIEVLLSAVRSRVLLFGKVIGVGLLGLVQMLAIAVTALTTAYVTGVVSLDAEMVGPVAYVALWFLLGYAFYAWAYAAVAARVAHQDELQVAALPLNLGVMINFLFALYVLQNPSSLAGRIVGLLPPFSALVQPVRSAGGDATPWEIFLSIGLMVAAIAGMAKVSIWLHDQAILRTGRRVGLREVLRRRSDGVR